MICALHDKVGITHGDLTTTNILVEHESFDLVFIDFGLAATGANPEQRAVDLHTFTRAIAANHPDEGEDFTELVLKSYSTFSDKGRAGYAQFLKVQTRGRKRNLC